MSKPASGTAQAAAPTASAWPRILTWRAHGVPRMESVRVQLSGNRIRASGRIIGADCAEHPAFSASYDLATDEAGTVTRLSLRALVASGTRQKSISRDEDSYWTVEDGTNSLRSTFGGAVEVDVVLSPFFNTLPIRRLGLHAESVDVEVPVAYVSLPDLTVREASLTYSSGSDGISVISPVSSATLSVDKHGFVLDYPGLAERI
ncbi:putative glycolipid-binding domain-containing protein [Aldersonia sp. NBC_00410]|uniref:putative glycolipid-binding domain-containing protein n=1 Tax=Aldersonia sp. NBC_00410 TaxID=2975954 RepID=UPI002250B3BB|nr:putative glycolipid-binding domain-containing protein [Aldersonia sp. NBC_00410]MCX5042126.1 putative glycolipid-binding domain-containing protein [Aldersonia sp. NBC_00410]